MLPNVIAGIIWLGISAYAIFGGADFGGGLWDLFAGGPEKGRRPRALIERAIGPVWEANHVWLIFVLVYLWTAFPEPFVSIATTLWIPLTLAALGIIFRGSGFAFRKWADTVGRQRWYGAWFAGASALTPFFLGTVVGGVASARVPLGNAEGDVFGSWLNPTSLLGGVMAVVACAYLAAVLLTREAVLDQETDLAEYFRLRGLIAGAAAGVVAIAGIFVLRWDAPSLYEGLLSTRGIVLIIGSAAGGVASLWLLWNRRFLAARPTAALATVAVLWGWGAAQYPWVLEDAASIEDFAASDPVLTAMIIAFAAAAVLVVPSLVWLFRLTQTRSLVEGDIRADSTEALMIKNQTPREKA
ncbi:MAG: cytochrome d ubiquinol oxidase subunit II [Actinobacteria bacterium]|nr:MAG: cytochrome d ubiquinol oxidase subunit II [Actinomycetota bacterium]